MHCETSRKRHLLVQIQVAMCHGGKTIPEIQEATKGWMRKKTVAQMQEEWKHYCPLDKSFQP